MLRLDRERVLAVADVHLLDLPAAALGVAGEHPVEVARPQARLLAAGAALDFDDHALVVVGVALDHRQADLLLELLDPPARRAELLAHLRVLAHLREQLLGAGGVVLSQAPLLRELRCGLELAVGATDFGVALPVGDHLGVGHLRAELGEARLDLLDELFDHAAECRRGGVPRESCSALAAQAATRLGAASSSSSSSVADRASTASRSSGRPSAPSDSSACGTGSSRSTTRAPIVASTLRSSACAHTAPNRPVLAPMTAAGLPRSGVRCDRTRDPVERVLERSGDRPVVLRRRDQKGVRVGDRRRQGDDRGDALLLVVLAVGRDRVELVEQHQLDAGGQQ